MSAPRCLLDKTRSTRLIWVIVVIALTGCKEKTKTVFISNDSAHYKISYDSGEEAKFTYESILVDYYFLKNYKNTLSLEEVRNIDFELRHDTLIKCEFGATYWV